MTPPVAAPKPVAGKPGYYQLEVTGLAKEPPVTYFVQLPPEYDPYRLYPTIVTLAGVSTPERQIDWWAGEWALHGGRTGQAARHGYIVIAPVWAEEHQKQYGYSAREHAAVLNSLRDACRRFSIDTDRVFLSGQSFGGDAAWDIGLAHPDLWTGVIPIVAQSDRYCARYWENARYVPFYVVAGELDGAKLIENALDLDRYLRRGFDTTVVEYLGRGHEDFYDEILRMFDWMGRFHRNFFPREFACEDDAVVGQFLLVGGVARAAAAVISRSVRLAAARGHPTRAGEGKTYRRQHAGHPHRHHPGDRLALAQDA